MSRRNLVTFAVLWVAALCAAMVIVRGDFAVWLFFLIPAQGLALLGIIDSRDGDPMPGSARVFLALPSAGFAALATFVLATAVIKLCHFRGEGVRMAVVILTVIAFVGLFAGLRYLLSRRPHPGGARRALAVVDGLGVVAFVAFALARRKHGLSQLDLMICTWPIAYTLPPWIATWPRRRDDIPVARAIP